MAESAQVLDIIQNSKDTDHYAFRIMQIEHSEIHDGRYYTAERSTSALGASSWMDLEIITPSTATAGIHMFFEINNSGGLAEVILAKLSTSSTYTHGGTEITAQNHNDLSSNTANTGIFTSGTNGAFLTSTVTSTQATFKRFYYAGSTGSNAVRGNVGADRTLNENVLAGATTYVLRMWNRGAAGYATVTAQWYED